MCFGSTVCLIPECIKQVVREKMRRNFKWSAHGLKRNIFRINYYLGMWARLGEGLMEQEQEQMLRTEMIEVLFVRGV